MKTKNKILSNAIYYETNVQTLSKAHALRNKMTPAEKLLWEELRLKKIKGLKFRRQHAIGQFIVDFYCHEKKLVIEVDGGYHLEKCQAIHDNDRNYELEKFGLKIMRFTNNEVLENIKIVVQEIESYVISLNPT
jgi:very-short-patch-repair endonuclease